MKIIKVLYFLDVIIVGKNLLELFMKLKVLNAINVMNVLKKNRVDIINILFKM
jgi:hypothetical protein